MKRLAIVTTHPIQYNAPLFAKLSKRNKLKIRVFYTWGEQGKEHVYDPGFNITRSWDIPLLDGYDHIFVKNTSRQPGSHHFRGIQNPTLVKELRDYHPDAILVYGWNFQSHLRMMRRLKGKIKIFFRGDSTLLDEPTGISLKKILRRMVLKTVYRYVDLAFYCGKNNKQYFLTNGLKDSNLIYVPHCIDIHRFTDKQEMYASEAALLRAEIGISASDIVFLFAGKLEAKKNVQLLIKAFVRLNNLDTKLVIIGNGPLENSLKRVADGNRNIIFMPFQNQSKMPVIYRLGHVFVLPSQGPGETWGLAINEAMACGRAIIASDKCGAAIDLVFEGDNGHVFKSNDVKDLCDKMNRVADQATIYRFGVRSAEIIKRFSYDACCQAIEETV